MKGDSLKCKDSCAQLSIGAFPTPLQKMSRKAMEKQGHLGGQKQEAEEPLPGGGGTFQGLIKEHPHTKLGSPTVFSQGHFSIALD